MSMPTAEQARTYHHGDLREALIDAAIRQMRVAGHAGVSLSALARELGVSAAAPYRHFASREELLAEIATRAFARFTRDLQLLLDAGDPTNMISAVAEAYLNWAKDNADEYILMYGSHLVEKASVGSPLQVSVERNFQMFLRAFPKTLGPEAAETIALELWISLHGIAMLQNQGFIPLKVRPIGVAELGNRSIERALHCIEQHHL